MNNRIFVNSPILLSEFCRSKRTRRIVAAVSAFCMLTVGSSSAFAGTSLLGGKAVLEGLTRVTQGATTADSVTFNSSAKVGILDWSKYNIGAGQSMTYNGAGTTFFNLVNGAAGKSQIDGMINGNGSVWVINPNGVAFGSESVVNVGGVFGVSAKALTDDCLEKLRAVDKMPEGGLTFKEFTATEASANEVQANEVAEAEPESDPGNVLVSKGAQFNGNDIDFTTGDWAPGKQVALVGKSVKVEEGAFLNADKVNIAAAKSAVMAKVDSVGDGTVSLNINAFTDVGSDINVTFDVPSNPGQTPTGPVEVVGNLSVVSEGNILVKGAVKADGAIVFHAGEPVSTAVVNHKNISVASGKYLQGKSVSASASGVVTIGGEGDSAEFAALDGLLEISAGQDINVVNATVKAGTFTVNESTGAVAIPAGHDAQNLMLTSGGKITVEGASRVGASKDVTLQKLTGTDPAVSGGDIAIKGGSKVAANGNLNVDANGAVSVSDASKVAANGAATVTGANGVTVDGSTVESVGDLTVTATTGDLVVKGAARLGTDAKLTATATAGSLKAQGTAVLTAGGEGDLDGKTGVEVASGAKVLTKGDATVDATEGAVTVKGLVKAGPFEVDETTGAVTPASPAAATLGIAGKAVDVDGGRVASSGNLTLTATDASGAGVKAQNGAKVATAGNLTVGSSAAVSVDGATVAARGTLGVTAGKGVSVDNGAAVKSSGNLTVTANGGAIEIGKTAAATVAAGENSPAQASTVKLDAKDATTPANGAVTVANGSSVLATAVVDVDATGAAEFASATVVGKTGVTVDSGDKVTVDGGVVKAGAFAYVPGEVPTVGEGDVADLKVTAKTGVEVKNGAALGASQDLTLQKASTGASGDITVSGSQVAANRNLTVDSAAAVSVSGGSVVAAKGAATVTGANGVTVDGSSVESVGDLTVTATTGDLVVKGAARLGTDGKLTATATAGSLKVQGTAVLTAGGEGDLDGKTGVEVASGAKVLAKGNATVDATEGAVTVNGVVKAGDFEVDETTGATDPEDPAAATLGIAGKSVDVDGGKVAASGDLSVTATDASGAGVKAQNGAKVATLGNLEVGSANAVSVSGGSVVAAKGAATVTGANGVTVDGSSVESVGDLTVTATTGDLVAKGASRLGTDGKLTANAAAGSLRAQDTAVLTAGGEGDLDGNSGVEIATGAKVLTKGNATVDATEGAVTVKGLVKAGPFEVDETTGAVTPASPAAATLGITGKSVDVDGGKVAASGDLTVTATDAAGDGVKAQNGAKVATAGNLTVGSSAAVSVDGATVAARGTLGVTAAKGVSVDSGAALKSSGGLTVTANGGAIEIGKTAAATVAAGENSPAQASTVKLDAQGAVTVANGSSVLATANVDVDATGAATFTSATVVGKTGVTVDSGAKVTVDGGVVKAGAFAYVPGEVPTIGEGDAADLKVTAKTGVEVKNGAALGASQDLTLQKASTGASGDITVSGSQVAANRNLAVDSAAVVSVSGGSAVAANGAATVTGANGVTVDGSSVESVGNLTVTATTGDLVAKGASRLGTDGKLTANAVAGSLKAQGTAVLTAGGEGDLDGKTGVEVASGAKVLTKGNTTVDATEGAVTVNGVVKAGDFEVDETTGATDPEDPAAATLGIAGKSVDVDGGKVAASGDLSVTATDAAGTGVKAQNGAKVATLGNLEVGSANAVSVSGGSVVAAKGAATVTGANGVTVDGSSVESVGDLTVTATTGDLVAKGASRLGTDGKLTATATAGSLRVQGTAVLTAGGEGDLDGKTGVEVASGAKVLTKGNTTVDATEGAVTVKGLVKAGPFEVDETTGAVTPASPAAATLGIAGKAVDVDGGKVASSGNLTLTATDASGAGVKAQNGAKVATLGNLEVGSANAVSVSGGSVVAAKGTATVTGANGVTVDGSSVESVGDLTVTATTGDLVAKGASRLGTDGKLTANAAAGSLRAQDTAVLIAKDNVSLTAKNAVTVTGTAVVEAGKAVSVKSTDAGDITVDTTKSVTANDGAVKIENANGAVTVRNATVEAKGDAGSVDIDATTGVTIQKGSQNAQVIAAQNVTVDTTGGGILVKDGSKVEATNGKLTADAATGSITVADKADVDAKTTLGLTAGTFVKVTENAQVNAGDAIAVMAKDGDVTVDASADVTSAKGVTITASKGVDVLDDATVAANGGDAVLTAQTEDVKVTGDIAASANVAVNANTTAEVSDNGTVKATAGNVSAVAQNAVTVKDTAEIEGNGVLLKGAAVETIGLASVKSTGTGTGGNLLIKATGSDVSLGQGTTIAASRNLKVEAAANVNQNTDLTAGGTVYVKAGSAGNVNMAEGTTTTTSGGNARFEAGQNMNIANVDVGDGGVSFAGHSVAVSGRITADGIGADLDGTFGTRENPAKLSVSKLSISAKKGIFIENSKDVGIVSQSAATDAFQVNDVQEDLSDGGKVPTASDVGGRVVDGLLAENGDVELKNQGDVTVAQSARIQAGSSVKADAEGNFTVDGTVTAGGETDINADGGVSVSGNVEGSAVNVDAGSDIAVNGKVHSGGETALTAQGGITVAANATVDGSTVRAKAGGAFKIDGNVKAGGENNVEAGGDVTFGSSGVAEGSTVAVKAGGSITQSSASLSVQNGYLSQNSGVRAAVKASNTATLTAGGSVGGAVSGSQMQYIGVDAGRVSASAGSGNAVIAAANGKSLTVGEGGIRAPNGTAAVYTSKTISTPGNAVIEGRNVNVTAHDYQPGTVNIKVTDRLTANNLEGGMNPGIAIFSTKGGTSNPQIDNLPNNMLIFIDGRLAGGDMKMMNKLGALEAFPVATPELKSEQGIFGNPVFLHDQLDVSNPLAVGAIDFLLEDRAELTYGAEFPAEADMQIAINGLSPTTSYRFGQNGEEGSENGEKGTGNGEEGTAK